MQAPHCFHSNKPIVSQKRFKQIITTVAHTRWKNTPVVWCFEITSHVPSRLSAGFQHSSQNLIKTSPANECPHRNMFATFISKVLVPNNSVPSSWRSSLPFIPFTLRLLGFLFSRRAWSWRRCSSAACRAFCFLDFVDLLKKKRTTKRVS